MARPKNIPDNLRPFDFHGMLLQYSYGEWWKSDCFFCGKEGHFHIGSSTGQWNCKRCNEKGNIASFLQRLHEASLKEFVSDTEWERLEKSRSVPRSEMQEWGLCKSTVTDNWLLPAHNPKGALTNLFKVVEVEGKWKAYATPQTPGFQCKIWPFGTHLLPTSRQATIVCEGPWDGMALRSAFKSLRKKKPTNSWEDLAASLIRNAKGNLHETIGVLSVPGASSFASEWVPFLQGDSVFFYDSDHAKQRCLKCRKPYSVTASKCPECSCKDRTGPLFTSGFDGARKAIEVVQEHQPDLPTGILLWGENGYDPTKPSGYDVRDCLNEHGILAGTNKLFSSVDMLSEGNSDESQPTEKVTHIEPEECTTYQELVATYERRLHVHQAMRDVLAFCLASIISTEIPGDQIWCRIIGPPGSGKTTIAECLSTSDYTYAQSVFTGFFSGIRSKGKRDLGLIEKIRNKTFIIKDGDTLNSNPKKDEILGEMRDIWDGSTSTHYKNNQGRSYKDLRTTILIFGTEDLKTLNRSFRGDRFLDCTILDRSTDTSPFLKTAVTHTERLFTSFFEGSEGFVRDADMDALKAKTAGYIKHIKETMRALKAPILSPEARLKLECIGQLLGCMRARVRRESGDLVYRPRVELGTRLASQLTKLSLCLAVILNRDSVDDEVSRIIDKIVNDTATGFQAEVMLLLRTHPEGLSVQTISLELHIGETTARKLLDDMHELRIIRRVSVPNHSGVRGRNSHLWTLTEDVSKTWDTAFPVLRKPKPKRKTNGRP